MYKSRVNGARLNVVCDFNVRIREVISMFGTFTVIIIALGK